jgi:hypothetical protein
MCRVNREGFLQILSDNDEVFLQHLVGVCESVDEYANLEITKTPQTIHFRVAPSIPLYTEMLLQEILKLHNLFQIHLDLSKSIKTSGTINFSINLQ